MSKYTSWCSIYPIFCKNDRGRFVLEQVLVFLVWWYILFPVLLSLQIIRWTECKCCCETKMSSWKGPILYLCWVIYCTLSLELNFNFMAPFYGWCSTVSRLLSHYYGVLKKIFLFETIKNGICFGSVSKQNAPFYIKCAPKNASMAQMSRICSIEVCWIRK